ncbi:hypothetical protein HX871_24615 [Pseudomonas reactans]|uniref:Uncharacterized protein n=1 Tax=Pseudomonas reactans TaxID=117680 RepID=A0ABX2R1W1_9PSED|nr:hypothetical protein [Pseudomonas reactans]NWA38224.1 hypothetical protein [Pseudomonas reactans]NWC88846.1 hypothetical protein [Pseudomonas reactans]NWD30728.1 hypothetical protein [Pseudomonas reactans]NWD97620.1 hypothetical protein [Pseudomonas reactans]NWF13379.1 hypothetical protein [Pseudomonas reactans]
MNIKWSICMLLLWASTGFSDEPARLSYSSATDFTDISMTLKRAGKSDSAYVEVDVSLSPEAKARTQSITLLAYQKYVTLYVDGYPLSTSKVQSQLGGAFRFSAPRALVVEWMSRFSREAVAAQPTM